MLVEGVGGAGAFELSVTAGEACDASAPRCAPEGACCFLSDCRLATARGCGLIGGVFAGEGTRCATPVFADDPLDPTDGFQRLPDGAFEDIAFSGSELGFTANVDDGGGRAPIGFDFPFFGETWDNVGVSSNGYLTFGVDYVDASNDSIPDALREPHALIAPWWDDLSSRSVFSRVLVETRGVEPDRRLIVQWDRVTSALREHDPTAALTFQAVLFEADGAVAFHYRETPADAAAHGWSIGIEGPDGASGVDLDPGLALPGAGYRIAPVTPEGPCAGVSSCEDVTGDGVVDLADLAALLTSFGTSIGDPRYDAQVDFNRDGVTDLIDLAGLLAVFGGPC